MVPAFARTTALSTDSNFKQPNFKQPRIIARGLRRRAAFLVVSFLFM